MKSSTAIKFPIIGQHPKPPKELGRAGARLWTDIVNEYDLTDKGGQSHLLSACRAEDDIQKMRKEVGDKLVVDDRFGQPKEHPLLAAIRGSETIKRMALAALNLDLEPIRDKIGRPGGR